MMPSLRRGSAVPLREIGFWGKLPQFADFVRHRTMRPVVRALDDWFREGEAALGDREAADAGTVRFLFHDGESRECLVGVFEPSSDRIGRSFPFAIFGVTDCDRWHSLAPVVFAGFLDQAAHLLHDADDIATTAEMVERVEALPTPGFDEIGEGEARYAEFVRETVTTDFLDGALPDTPGERKVALAARLHALCEPLRGQVGARSTISIRFPLADDAPELFAAFWIELAWRLLALAPAAPVALWAPKAASPFLLLPLGKTTGRLYATLFGATDDGQCDLTQDAPPATRSSPPPLVENPALLLGDVLRKAQMP
jgi:type VI secretion system protein ImpM